MISLRPIIERIKALVDEDTDSSITYAALEARLALEKVCYDRLRQAHDYISHNQLRRWQPHAVVTQLMAEVDPYVAEDRRLMMSRDPAIPGVDPDADDYVEVGTEIGFNPKLIGEMWNALSGLALHVKLPANKNHRISDYGDRDRTRKKIVQVVAELEKLSKSTMSFSGFGKEVSFACACGETNRRRAALLSNDQLIHCLNPDCKMTWKTLLEGDEFTFESQSIPINCEKCTDENHIPSRYFSEMKPNQTGSFLCSVCQHKNFVQWRLMQVRPTESSVAQQG
jgi:Zn finger protein HypA/HybF involved in hydrogenase expression